MGDARFISGVGALVVALGIGVGLAASAGVASASPTNSGPSSSSDSSSDPSSVPPRESPRRRKARRAPTPPRCWVRRLRGRDRPGHPYDRRSPRRPIGVICARIALRQNGKGVEHRRARSAHTSGIGHTAAPEERRSATSTAGTPAEQKSSGAEVAAPTKSTTDSENRHTNATWRHPAASSPTSGPTPERRSRGPRPSPTRAAQPRS